MRLSDSPRTLYLAGGVVVLVVCFLVATLWRSYEKVEALEDLVDALKSQNEAGTELIWIQEQSLHTRDELIRVQGEQISTLESLVEALETRESLNSLSTTRESQPR